jgi:hypothetical protein
VQQVRQVLGAGCFEVGEVKDATAPLALLRGRTDFRRDQLCLGHPKLARFGWHLGRKTVPVCLEGADVRKVDGVGTENTPEAPPREGLEVAEAAVAGFCSCTCVTTARRQVCCRLSSSSSRVGCCRRWRWWCRFVWVRRWWWLTRAAAQAWCSATTRKSGSSLQC